ncbi:hypothetical protein VA7868_03915 [Vibrio aerogenes CECT 7868]|uniref:DUF4062 domain-containing protein n=1 Tax=Vibrio aerogenes CECT 7868 TaxID=1216006 RepID=A0A1M6C1H6_9VIBR|nr:hypothetical protein [Vibrio aerogenes]SHI54548.1 hypothetical protein VA7868_03915 [Vibrio aerogenes CECT 7868]
MNHLFISVASAGGHRCIEQIKSRLGESSVLQQCGYHPFHMLRAEEYRNASFDNHLQTIRHSRYMICLLGQSDDESDAAALDAEIEAALDCDVDIIAFCAGDVCRQTALPEAIAEQCKKLPRSAKVETIASADSEVIARAITQVMELEVLGVLGGNDSDVPGTDFLSRDFLNIPGFSARLCGNFLPEISAQLERIYQTGAPDQSASLLAGEMAQRKRWACESLSYGHPDAAILNLQKVHEEFGSDFFVCFWLGRLYILYGTDERQFSQGERLSRRALSMLQPAETLLFSFCYTHLGRASTKLGHLVQAGECFDIASGAFHTDEIDEFRAALCLQQMTSAQESRWLDQAATCLSGLLHKKLTHFLSARPRLEAEYDGYFLQAEQRILQQWESFYSVAYDVTSQHYFWAAENFYGFRNKPVRIDKMQYILQCVMEIAQLNRQNYRILHQVAGQIQARYEHVQHDVRELQERRRKLDFEQEEITRLVEESNPLVTEREAILTEEKVLKAEAEKAEKKVFYSSCLILAALVLMTFVVIRVVDLDMRQQDTLLFVLSGLFFFSLGLPYIFSGNYRKMKGQLGKLAGRRCVIKDHLPGLWRDTEPEVMADMLRVRLTEIKDTPDSVTVACLDEICHDVQQYAAREYKRLSETEDDCHRQYEKLKALAAAWCENVDVFESRLISAWHGQYNHLLCRSEQVEVSEIPEPDDSDRQCRFFAKQSGHLVLHVRGSRMRAWFSEIQSATMMMDDLYPNDLDHASSGHLGRCDSGGSSQAQETQMHGG